jgi:hypothetical protein
MNSVIKQYFEDIELRFLESPIVIRYENIRREVAFNDGKIRIKAYLVDGGVFEMFEYVTDTAGIINIKKYSFHWQDRNGSLLRRWDNAPHYPDLPGAPHHVHLDENIAQGVQPPPSVFDALEFLEEEL